MLESPRQVLLPAVDDGIELGGDGEAEVLDQERVLDVAQGAVARVRPGQRPAQAGDLHQAWRRAVARTDRRQHGVDGGRREAAEQVRSDARGERICGLEANLAQMACRERPQAVGQDWCLAAERRSQSLAEVGRAGEAQAHGGDRSTAEFFGHGR
ncbi:MAG: hypothetical protein J2O47_09680 [Acidimicrobiaceae bacterium]|nr:hypothetical protein [Acidimicrobiaceae bacterium]